jgi:peptidoglycan/LPS O-acetylase OafA/YrhL
MIEPTAEARQPRLPALTILRFFAAIWVVCLHLQYRLPLDVPSLVKRFLLNGAYAMTLFFVLSGVVIAYSYHRLRPRTGEVIAFYQARFARIYVPYAVLHLIALAFFPAPEANTRVTTVYIHVLSALGLQAWFPHASLVGANSGTWSISVEFFFYALFPALLPLIAYFRMRWGAFRVAAYLSAFSGFIGLADYAFANGSIYYWMPAARLPEFMLGVVLGLELVDVSRRKSDCNPTRRLVLATAAAFVVSLNPALDYGIWIRANLIVVPAFGWLIFELARWDQHHTAPSSVFSRLLVYLGECSYCLFLVHMIPVLYFDSPTGRAWTAVHTGGSHALWWAVAVAASLGGSILMHECVEKPARRALLRRWSNPAPAVVNS